MARNVDYYFSLLSPYAYLGHVPFMAIVRRHDVEVTCNPVLLPSVFAETGGLPFPSAIRFGSAIASSSCSAGEKRGLKFNLHPRFWPFDPEMADRFVIAIVAAGHDPDPFLRRAFAAVWAGEQYLADDATLIALADSVTLPGEALLADARREESKAKYEQNIKDAIAGDVIGSPGYVLDGEVFGVRIGSTFSTTHSRPVGPPYRSDA